MKTHYLPSILGISFACAAAVPGAAAPVAPQVPRQPPPPDACTADSNVLFGMKTGTQSLVLAEGGRWSVVDDTGARNGCLDAATVAKLRAQLARAPWHVYFSARACIAIAKSATEYTVFGKPVFSDDHCSRMLDEVSQKILDDVTRTLTAVTAKPRPFAACGSLVPLFRIDHRSDIPHLRTWSVEVSVDGALTFDVTAADGTHQHR